MIYENEIMPITVFLF